MEGEGDLLKAVSLSLQASHTLRELPRKPPPASGNNYLRIAGRRGSCGEALFLGREVDFRLCGCRTLSMSETRFEY